MQRRVVIVLAIGFLVAAAVPGPSEARVVRFVVEQQRSFAGGVEWGTTGAYERLDGTAYLEVDPQEAGARTEASRCPLGTQEERDARANARIPGG
jgi:hypothetical protein